MQDYCCWYSCQPQRPLDDSESRTQLLLKGIRNQHWFKLGNFQILLQKFWGLSGFSNALKVSVASV